MMSSDKYVVFLLSICHLRTKTMPNMVCKNDAIPINLSKLFFQIRSLITFRSRFFKTLKPIQMNHAISWFEIPSLDINRAASFYEAIFKLQLIPLNVEQIEMRMFPIDDPATGIGGAIVYHKDFYKISATDGPLIYLNGNPDLQHVLDSVESAGGQIIVPKTPITPEYGFMAIIIDTEGNRIGLHSIS